MKERYKMSMQNQKKPVRKIPESLISTIETRIGQAIAETEYQGYYWRSGNSFETFVVNGEYIITIINDEKIDPLIKSAKKEADEKKAFGRRVKSLQSKTKLPYDLAKMAARKHPDLDSEAQRLLFSIKRAKTKFIENNEETKRRLREAMSESRMQEIVSMLLAYKVSLTSQEEALIIKYWLK